MLCRTVNWYNKHGNLTDPIRLSQAADAPDISTVSRDKEVLVFIPNFSRSTTTLTGKECIRSLHKCGWLGQPHTQVQDILCEIKPNQAMKILYDLDTAKDKD